MDDHTYKGGSVLLPTAYLPPLEYFAWLLVASEASIELHETYPKQTLRNRCTIMAANGLLTLSIPVSKPLGSRTKTCDVRTSIHENWQDRHWRSILSAYGKSPYFIYYEDLFSPFFASPWDGPLWQWNMKLLGAVMKEFGLGTPVHPTKAFVAQPGKAVDLRNNIGTHERTGQTPLMRRWPEYFQTFSGKHGFVPNLSILDLVCNAGPDARSYLEFATGT